MTSITIHRRPVAGRADDGRHDVLPAGRHLQWRASPPSLQRRDSNPPRRGYEPRGLARGRCIVSTHARRGTPPGNRTLLSGFGDQTRPRRRRRSTRRHRRARDGGTTGRTRTLAGDVRSVASHPRDGGQYALSRAPCPPPAPAGAGYAVPQGGIAGEAVDSPADVVRRRRQPARVRSAPGGNRTHHCWIERPADYPLSDWDRGRPSSTGWTTQTRARGTWSAGSLEGPAGIAASPVESERDGSPAQDSWRAVVFLPSDARPTRPLEEAAGTDASDASGGPGRNRTCVTRLNKPPLSH